MSMVSSLNVLIVEDDTDARKNLRDVLSTDGYRVETATTAAEAFGRADLAETDVVILGRRLLDGYVEDVLPRLREIAPDASIIVATEYADLESTIAALRLGVAEKSLDAIKTESCFRSS